MTDRREELLDEIARAHMRAAVDALLAESASKGNGPEAQNREACGRTSSTAECESSGHANPAR